MLPTGIHLKNVNNG